MSSDTCEIEVTLAPSQEFADLPERMRQRMENDPNFAYRSMYPSIKTRRDARSTRLAPEFKRIWNAYYAYQDKLRGYPYRSGVQCRVTVGHGMVCPRTEWLSRSTSSIWWTCAQFQSEGWIPNCIGGVPVHIVVGNHAANSDASPDEAGIQ